MSDENISVAGTLLIFLEQLSLKLCISSYSDSLVTIPRAYWLAKPWKVLSPVFNLHSRRSLMQSNNETHLWSFLMNTCCRREYQIA